MPEMIRTTDEFLLLLNRLEQTATTGTACAVTGPEAAFLITSLLALRQKVQAGA